MMIQVIANEVNEHGGIWIELSSEKKAISVYVGGSYLSVCVQNAMHAAYRGGGRTFHSEDRFAEAIASYKCSTVRALIECAKDLAAGHAVAA